jgi:hypothetical protein
MCGTVRYEVIGKSFAVVHCRYSSCRRHTEAPVGSPEGLKKDQVGFTAGERRIYASSAGVGRAFYGECGTPLTWEGDGGELGPLVELHISTFDDPSAFVPLLHLLHDERLPWFEVADTLPRYHERDDRDPYRYGPGATIEDTDCNGSMTSPGHRLHHEVRMSKDVEFRTRSVKKIEHSSEY